MSDKIMTRREVAASTTKITLGNDLPAVEILQPVMEADYLINLHLFKKHYSGVTGALKNLLGLTNNVGRIAHQGGSQGVPYRHAAARAEYGCRDPQAGRPLYQ